MTLCMCARTHCALCLHAMNEITRTVSRVVSTIYCHIELNAIFRVQAAEWVTVQYMHITRS